MKNRMFYLLLFLLSILLFSCSQGKPEDTVILARINDFNLTLNEYQTKLAAELEMDRDFKLTKEARNEFLEGIIRKELLIQEAARMNLDKEERFVRAIERYWEATLIRDLMEMKGGEISQKILISQEEIEARYDEMKRREAGIPPLAELEGAITKDLKDRKKTRLLREWIDELRQKAKIEINRELLYKK